MASVSRVVAENTLAQAAARGITFLLSLVTVPFLTRYLEPDLFGAYSLIVTLNAFLITFADLGIQTIAVRDGSKDPTQLGVFAKQALFLRTLSSLGLAAVSSGILLFSPYLVVIKVGFIILAVGVVVTALQSGYAVILQAKLKVYLLGLADAVSRALIAFVTLGVILSSSFLTYRKETGLYFVLLSLVLGSLAGLLVLRFSSRDVSARAGGLNLSLSKRILQDSVPLGVVAVFSLVHYRIDTVLLSILNDASAVGIYNVAYRFLDLVLSFPGLLMASLFPLLSAALQDPERFRRLAQRSFDILALAAVPIALGTYLVAPQIVSILGGEEFSAAVLPLRILAFAAIFSYLNTIFAYLVILKNRQRSILAISVVGVTLNIVLNLVFIPLYSFNGAAAVTVFSELAGMAMMAFLALRVSGLTLDLFRLLKTTIAGLAMLVVLYPLRDHNILLVATLGVLVYAILVASLRIVDKETLLAIVRKG